VAGSVVLEDVHKRYRTYRARYRSLKEIAIHRRLGAWEDHWALQGLSLEVQPGSTLGLVGPNGAGKSTVLKLMARILAPDRGRVTLRGRVSALIELGAGFQLEYTGRENVYLNASLLGMTRSETDRRFADIVAFSELEEYIDSPVRTYSSGMYMRLGFSVAIHVDPELMLVDEILAVGDESFQRKCYDWLEAFQVRGGTLVMVSHNLAAIREMCTQAAWIGRGRLLRLGDSSSVVNAYLDEVREDRWESERERLAGRSAADLPAVELGEVRLLDGQARPVEELASGEPLTVEIPYRVNRRLETPVFGVALLRNDGVYVYGSNTAVDGLRLPPLEPGPGRLSLHYSGLDLLSGTYLLTVSVFAATKLHATPVDVHAERYRFRVVSEKHDQGLVRLEHHWQLPAARPGRRANLG